MAINRRNIRHTSPGIHPDFRMDGYPSSVQLSIRRLADHFYVTRSFLPIEIGNSKYFAALVRPTDETSIYLNTQREIVAIFSQYEAFEIRTLEAFDEAYSHVESSRIDDSIRFLISGDSNVEHQIRHYLSSHPEYPIVIPIDDAVLKFKGGRPLIDAIQRNYVIRDLFGFQAPLRQEYFFFGRQSTVGDVIDLSKSGQNSSLFGLRKSGKTSAIYAIQRKSKGTGLNVVSIDCQSPAIHARRYNSLLVYVLNEIKRILGQRQKDFVVSTDLPIFAEQISAEFKRTISSAAGPVVIVFDEIENISPETAASEHWRSGNDPVHFWQLLRSIYQEQASLKLAFCIVGTSPKLLEVAKINDIDNPVYLFAQKKFIPSLSYSEVNDMLTKLGFFMGMEFPETTISQIYDLYGGHPFFTRQLCSVIHRQISTERPVTISKADVERAQKTYGADLESYLIETLRSIRNLYLDEFSLLAAAIKGDDIEFVEFIKEAPDLLDHLIGYGLVRRVGSDYELAYSSIKSALFKAFPEFITNTETAIAEISKRRNSVEQLLRRNLYAWSRNLTPSEFTEILQKSLTSKRFDALDSLEPKRIFSNEISPLYLTDIVAILKLDTVLPEVVKDMRSDVRSHLNILNRNRSDAHAKNVSGKELDEVRKSADFLEEVFFLP